MAATIAAVAPDPGGTVVPTVGVNGSTAMTNGATVNLPASSDGVVTITPAPSGDVVLDPVTISLPKEIAGKHSDKARNGVMVYSASDQGADAAIQVLTDRSVRLQTVTTSAKGAQKFTYSFGDATPVLQPDGSVAIVRFFTTPVVAEQTVGVIAPAWAVDAAGQPVATHYEVRGNGQLVQVISPDKTTKYPVVADPQYSFVLYGVHIYFNRQETNKLALHYSLAVATAGLVVAFGPGPAKVVAGVIASVGTGYAGIANYYYNQGKCLEVTIMYVPTGMSIPTGYSGGNCR